MIGLTFAGRRASCLRCRYSWPVLTGGRIVIHRLYVGRSERIFCGQQAEL